MVTQELINQFFRNECSDEEKQLVLRFLEEHPELWDQHLNEPDWEQFETNQRLHPALTNKLFERVSKQTIKRRSYKKLAIAACVVLLTGLAVALLWQQNAVQLSTGSTADAIANVQLKSRTNNTGVAMAISMEDGSVVTLSPNSTINYYQPFTQNNKRTIYLEGQGTFQVAKDANHPFTVFADAVSTTALGTQFVVSAYKENNEIRVALLEGKIVVQPTDSIQLKWTTNYYLAPGDEVIYNKRTMLASLNRARTEKEELVKAQVPRNGYNVQKPEWYEFEVSALTEVLNQLSAYYQVDIYYYPADIRNKYFSGRMRKTDSLENILNDIALLNHLSISRKNGAYIIKKTR